MAFFDKISSTVTEATQKTLAKTKDFADVTKLNATISEQEKIIKTQYSFIGEQYLNLHRHDYENGFSAMMDTIFAAEAVIEDCRRQIQEIKEVQSCPNCGAEIPYGVAFCTACGTNMPKVEPKPEPPVREGFAKCQNCGAEVEESMSFCTTCGKPVVIEEVQAEAVEPIAEPVVAGNVCPGCGAEIEEGFAFCIKCGTKL